MSKLYDDIVESIEEVLKRLVTHIDDPEERDTINSLINRVAKNEPSNEPKSKKLNDYTWEEIRKISDNGEAANHFSIGDTKTIIINGNATGYKFNNLSIDAFIIGINHNSEFEGGNRIHFQIGKINGVDVALVDDGYGFNTDDTRAATFTMNKCLTNFGGWVNSDMRLYVLGNGHPIYGETLLMVLPNDLRSVMKPITKYSDNIGDGIGEDWCVTATTDYLTLLSEFEYHGTRTHANSAEQNYQKQYDYYAAGNSKVKYKHNNTSSAVSHWCRSVLVAYSSTFCSVYTIGAAGGYGANTSRGVSPCFAV